MDLYNSNPNKSIKFIKSFRLCMDLFGFLDKGLIWYFYKVECLKKDFTKSCRAFWNSLYFIFNCLTRVRLSLYTQSKYPIFSRSIHLLNHQNVLHLSQTQPTHLLSSLTDLSSVYLQFCSDFTRILSTYNLELFICSSPLSLWYGFPSRLYGFFILFVLLSPVVYRSHLTSGVM